jgi:DNA-binding IscR family transcriptional regulator
MASISSRFAVAIHILALVDMFPDEHTTSEFLAGSIGTNPVVVRRISKALADAGLLHVRPGVGGAELARPLEKIRLLDVYKAVGAVDADRLFAIHDRPNPACQVGATIQESLEGVFRDAQRAMEHVLERRTMRDVVSDLSKRSAARSRAGATHA